ncbi:MAG: beta-ketoacyl synthase N-terminal-like domain-containing protein [Gilvibacter sp.]
MKHPISISGITSVSALGFGSDTVWQSYQTGSSMFVKFALEQEQVWVSKLHPAQKKEIEALRQENLLYKKLDPTVLMVLLAARQTMSQFKGDPSKLGINIGSSRGATHLFEGYYHDFIANEKTHPLSSPTTTLGNIASWVAQDIGAGGIAMSHSITCSSAMHALLNGITWLESNRAQAFLVGGSEAPLTPFTIAQMQALKLYSKQEGAYPCQSMLEDKNHNTMILGEGATTAILQKGIQENSEAIILGVGWGSEVINHPAAISAEADCFKQSMKMALEEAGLKTVDALVMHAPGTVLGDSAEFMAIRKVFGDSQPFLTGNKAIIGHTLGASGGFNLELAVLMIKHNQTIAPALFENPSVPTEVKTVMINAVGFGANAVSIIIGKP